MIKTIFTFESIKFGTFSIDGQRHSINEAYAKLCEKLYDRNTVVMSGFIWPNNTIEVTTTPRDKDYAAESQTDTFVYHRQTYEDGILIDAK